MLVGYILNRKQFIFLSSIEMKLTFYFDETKESNNRCNNQLLN